MTTIQHQAQAEVAQQANAKHAGELSLLAAMNERAVELFWEHERKSACGHKRRYEEGGRCLVCRNKELEAKLAMVAKELRDVAA